MFMLKLKPKSKSKPKPKSQKATKEEPQEARKGEVIAFTQKDWKQEVMEAKLPVLVDFSATWCGPCQIIASFIEQIAQQRKDTLKVGKVDIDKDEALTDKYDVQGVPTLLVFMDGEVIGTTVGSMPRKHIEEFIDSALKGKRPGLSKKG
jgi:thioredoxin 1